MTDRHRHHHDQIAFYRTQRQRRRQCLDQQSTSEHSRTRPRAVRVRVVVRCHAHDATHAFRSAVYRSRRAARPFRRCAGICGNDACDRDASADHQHSHRFIPDCLTDCVEVFQLHRKPPRDPPPKYMLRRLLAARKGGKPHQTHQRPPQGHPGNALRRRVVRFGPGRLLARPGFVSGPGRPVMFTP